MTYDVTSPAKPKSPLEHPTYSEGMDYLDNGQWPKAIEAFEALHKLYPESVDIRELLADVHMRATMAQAQARQKAKSSPERMAHVVVVSVLVTIVFSMVGLIAYEWWIDPVLLHEYRVRQLAELRQKADEAIIAGHYAEARQTLEEMQAILPEDADTGETLQRVEQLEKMTSLYDEAQKLMAAGEWGQAIETLTELQSLDAQYRDLPDLLTTAQEAQTLEEQFQAAETAFANGDWDKALAQYETLHQTNLTFRFEAIQTRLFESHLKYAQELIAAAKTDSNQVTEALSHFSEALTIRPVDAEALDERRLAETYLTVLNSDDRDQAIDLLQTIYAERPDYAGQAAVELLYAHLVARADAQVAAGQPQRAQTDYQAAAKLPVADSSEAQEKLAALSTDSNS